MKKIFIVSVISVLCLYSCVYDHVERIQIVNNSEEGQVVYHSCSDRMGAEMDSFSNLHYERMAGRNRPIHYERAYIAKDSVRGYGNFFSKKATACFCEDKKVRFFFISESVFITTPWDTLVKYQMYNRKLVFTDEELKKNDWVVIYE